VQLQTDFDTYSAKLVNCSFYFFQCRLTDSHWVLLITWFLI